MPPKAATTPYAWPWRGPSARRPINYLGAKVAADKAAAPAMVRLIAVIADRFGIQVAEKVAAQAVPALGTAGGALINTLFIDHFQDVARGHFIVRRLERRYGKEAVHAVYMAL
nr:EcsC family protein [uncultured Castellaniella sp.]